MSKFKLHEVLRILDEYDTDIEQMTEETESCEFVDDVSETTTVDNVSNASDINKTIVTNNTVTTFDNSEVNDFEVEELLVATKYEETASHVETPEPHYQNTLITVEVYDADAVSPSYLEEIERTGVVLNIADIRQSNANETRSNDSAETVSYTDVNMNEVKDEVYFENDTDLSVTKRDDIGSPGESQHYYVESVDGNQHRKEEKRSRPRYKDIDKWKKTIRKRRRQSGLDYTSSKGKQIEGKSIKIRKDCKEKCRLQCAWHVSDDDVREIHSDFWSLTDDQKLIFYADTTERVPKGKRKSTHKNYISKRKFTYRYYFRKSDTKIQVCQEFYLGVLGINVSRVQTYYEKQDHKQEFRDMRGRKTKSRTPKTDTDFVKEHINSFNKVPSHYCRSSTNKEYLESHLNIQKMYEMYKEVCTKRQYKPVKQSMYYNIFKTDFNLAFHVPKKDRCDLCEEIKKKIERQETLDVENKTKYEIHNLEKVETKTERDNDRKSQQNKATAVICFDLENVLALPRAEVSNFFYKRKLNTFNLTAHCSIDKSVYNAIWTEADAGRGGNEIASTLVAILHEVHLEFPTIKDYILWSDSCVPQNRNSIMSYALKTFMKSHHICTITQKFGCPGHSAIQEVDNAHSNIEKVLKCTEVFSPVSLVRALKSVGARRKSKFHVIQMRPNNFYDFQKVTNTLKFGSVPYTKVKCLKYIRENEMGIYFKLSFSEVVFRDGTIKGNMGTRSGVNKSITSLPIPDRISPHKKPVITFLKKRDITCMLKYMSLLDSQYYIAKHLVVPRNIEGHNQTPEKKRRVDDD